MRQQSCIACDNHCCVMGVSNALKSNRSLYPWYREKEHSKQTRQNYVNIKVCSRQLITFNINSLVVCLKCEILYICINQSVSNSCTKTNLLNLNWPNYTMWHSALNLFTHNWLISVCFSQSPIVSAMETQTEKKHRQFIHLEFKEDTLSYMEKLLLKQSRRLTLYILNQT